MAPVGSISRAALSGPLLLCYALCGVVHVASVALNTLVPFHVIDLGGSRAQVGLLFSVMTIVSMVLRPAVGGWIDGFGVRPVLLPGIAVLGVVSLVLHLPREARTVVLVMAGAGLANALINTTNSVVTARASSAPHRGQALSLYYLSSSLGIAVAAPLALTLRAWGGMTLAFVAVTTLALVLLVLALALPRAVCGPVLGARLGFRVFSRHALPVTPALVLTTIGHSSIYAFLPLYAVGRGHGALVAWFFIVYSCCVIVGRALFGSLSDRVGRSQVALPAMGLTALGYFALAVPPTPLSVIVAAVLLGSGGAVLYPTLVALVLDRTPDTERGVALGSVSSAWDLGVVVGSTLVGFVADRLSFGAGFAVAGAAAGFGALAFARRERHEARAHAAPVPSPAP